MILSRVVRFYVSPQFPRFLVFSAIAALINLSVGYFLYEILGLSQGWQYALSVSIAFFAGMGVSFVLNRALTFAPSGRPVHHGVRTFFVVSLGGLVLTVALSWLLRSSLMPAVVAVPWVAARLPSAVNAEMLSHLVAVGCVAFYSFTCHKLFSFGRGLRGLRPGRAEPAVAARRVGARRR